MDDKYTIIDNHYEEYKEEPKPKHVDSQYKKFKEMYNDGDRDLHNEIRVDCELLLLNNMEKQTIVDTSYLKIITKKKY